MNPSSGNLHPTEAHLILPEITGFDSGVYHYSPYYHALEKRAKLPDSVPGVLNRHFGTHGFLVGLTSIFWRESWKYGERAFRYCNHDVGHALAAMSISANLMGWKMVYLNTLSDENISIALGLGKTKWHEVEAEHPDAMCFIYPADAAVSTTPKTNGESIPHIPRSLPDEFITAMRDVEFTGEPNKLSDEQIRWDIIYMVAEMTGKKTTTEESFQLETGDFKQSAESKFDAARIIRKRRSGVDYDPSRSFMEKKRFLSILDKTISRENHAPFDLRLQEPMINLLIFVHQVTGLEPGLYGFIRNPTHLEMFKQEFHSNFKWEQVVEDFPLYLLEKNDYRGTGMNVSCDQEIGGYGAFSLGMLARFSDVLEKRAVPIPSFVLGSRDGGAGALPGM